MEIEIQEIKPVWVAWSNTDLTEGRGRSYPKHVAVSYEAACRLGRKGSVQGSNCDVREAIAVKVKNQWLVPGVIETEISEDVTLRAKRERMEMAVSKAKDAGLSDEDIKLLTGGA